MDERDTSRTSYSTTNSIVCVVAAMVTRARRRVGSAGCTSVTLGVGGVGNQSSHDDASCQATEAAALEPKDQDVLNFGRSCRSSCHDRRGTATCPVL
jgi:hypothetical protein